VKKAYGTITIDEITLKASMADVGAFLRVVEGWALIWLMYDLARLAGLSPALPRCRHTDWTTRGERCCEAVRAAHWPPSRYEWPGLT